MEIKIYPKRMFNLSNCPVKKRLIQKVFGIHIGDYFFWDDERQVEFIKKEYGEGNKMEGTYKRYKSVDV